MKINYSHKQNFQASWVKDVEIAKLIPNTKNYAACDARLVRLNPHDKFDLQALDDVANTWEYDKFSVNIFNNAFDIYKGIEDPQYQIYAITKQKDNFNILNPDDILALSDLNEHYKNKAYLLHIQVKPDYVYSNLPEFKGIGSAIIEYLKEIFSQINLRSSPELSVKNFYKKHKFQNYTNSKTEFVWQKSFENQQ